MKSDHVIRKVTTQAMVVRFSIWQFDLIYIIPRHINTEHMKCSLRFKAN